MDGHLADRSAGRITGCCAKQHKGDNLLPNVQPKRANGFALQPT